MNLIQRFRSLLAKKQGNKNRFAELSYVGHRDINQDYATHLFTGHGKLFILADGLGGHQGGELASNFFCNALLMLAKNHLKQLKKQPQETLISLAEQAANIMSEKLITEYPGINAHTTCAICWLSSDNHLTTLHIGDTRIYWLSPHRISWHSRDHSVIQTLVDAGTITEAQMGTHPNQGALTRSIAVGRKIQPSYKTHQKPMRKGDALLLCTDGFWEQVSNSEIISLAKSKKPELDLDTWIKTAIVRANNRSDNVTAQLYIL